MEGLTSVIGPECRVAAASKEGRISIMLTKKVWLGIAVVVVLAAVVVHRICIATPY